MAKKNLENSKTASVDERVDMDEVVTRRILSEEFEKFEARFEAKIDMKLDSKLDSKLTEQRKEYERYLGALAEDFNDKIKSIGEGISMILERGAEDSEKNRREHEWFKNRIARLEAKVFVS